MTDQLPPLFHYSAEPLAEVRPVIQDHPPHLSFAYKPRGLWLSVEGEWEEWCRGNEFGLDRLKIKHAVIVAEPQRMLWLKTPDDILAFQKTFAKSDGITSYPAIDWVAVAEQHTGLLIAPYQWSCRLSVMWYYCWDCASGCIWDTSIIESCAPVDRKGNADAIDTSAEPVDKNAIRHTVDRTG